MYKEVAPHIFTIKYGSVVGVTLRNNYTENATEPNQLASNRYFPNKPHRMQQTILN